MAKVEVDRSDPNPVDHEMLDASLVRTVDIKEHRKLRARRDLGQGIWFGLGMFGVVGWSVAVPMLLLLALGIWIDGQFPSRYSWTLMFLFVGFVAGCLNAWYWVSRERTKIDQSSSVEREPQDS